MDRPNKASFRPPHLVDDQAGLKLLQRAKQDFGLVLVAPFHEFQETINGFRNPVGAFGGLLDEIRHSIAPNAELQNAKSYRAQELVGVFDGSRIGIDDQDRQIGDREEIDAVEVGPGPSVHDGVSLIERFDMAQQPLVLEVG